MILHFFFFFSQYAVECADDEKLDDSDDPGTEQYHVESRRDMATQMSLEENQSGRLIIRRFSSRGPSP